MIKVDVVRLIFEVYEIKLKVFWGIVLGYDLDDLLSYLLAIATRR